MDILQIKNLSLKLGNTQILKNLSFNVPKKSICAFLGSNGAGKTTTIKCIVGLYPYNEGQITINGMDAKDAKSHYYISYVPEKENFPKISVKRFLDSLCEYYQLDKTKTNDLIRKAYSLFEIEGFGDRKLTRLSSGQKKKILVIQALLNNPKLIIMDEPTENMDPDTRKVFYEIISIFKQQGKTIFISTHNLDEIQQHADHVIIIKDGEVKHTGNINDKNLHAMYDKYTDHAKTVEKKQEVKKLTAKDVFGN